ncbi:hypothetical protein JKP88DRAFT_242305 [Tribonema minus]|uniref:Uncharacterized protein n=1 Tax=Tribonema minus TaxID=303371 RepID=A0A835YL66_9STRA|nr:hypothetical protein JKP88DRAFT_242305 [Tribonema minus]
MGFPDIVGWVISVFQSANKQPPSSAPAEKQQGGAPHAAPTGAASVTALQAERAVIAAAEQKQNDNKATIFESTSSSPSRPAAVQKQNDNKATIFESTSSSPSRPAAVQKQNDNKATIFESTSSSPSRPAAVQLRPATSEVKDLVATSSAPAQAILSPIGTSLRAGATIGTLLQPEHHPPALRRLLVGTASTEECTSVSAPSASIDDGAEEAVVCPLFTGAAVALGGALDATGQATAHIIDDIGKTCSELLQVGEHCGRAWWNDAQEERRRRHAAWQEDQECQQRAREYHKRCIARNAEIDRAMAAESAADAKAQREQKALEKQRQRRDEELHGYVIPAAPHGSAACSAFSWAVGDVGANIDLSRPGLSSLREFQPKAPEANATESNAAAHGGPRFVAASPYRRASPPQLPTIAEEGGPRLSRTSAYWLLMGDRDVDLTLPGLSSLLELRSVAYEAEGNFNEGA